MCMCVCGFICIIYYIHIHIYMIFLNKGEHEVKSGVREEVRQKLGRGVR